MKWLGILVLPLFFIGCKTLPDLQETFTASGYDFNKYVEKGFLITPELYNGDYVVVGLLECSVIPEVLLENSENKAMMELSKQKKLEYYAKFIGGKKYHVKKIDTDSLISYMHVTALSLNADAIMKFNISTEILPEYYVPFPKITGIAIKRQGLNSKTK